MIAFVCTALAAACTGAIFGFVAGVFCADQRIADLELERDVARADAARWRARCAPMFSTGTGSPWAPITEDVEAAP